MTAAEIERYVDAAAAAFGLPIDPTDRPGVVANFARLAHAAGLVAGLDLGPEVEPALRFAHDRA
jgi:hypothetical protein